MSQTRTTLLEKRESLAAAIEDYLRHEVDTGSFPGAVWAIGDCDGVILDGAIGNAVVRPARIPATTATRYDVASLTKPLVTTSLALIAHAQGRADIDEPISRWLPELNEDKRDLTLTDLLTHRAGFQAWYPLYTAGFGSENYLRALVSRPLRYKPREGEIYTCLGMILARIVLERVWDEPLEETARRELFEPLGVETAAFNPPPLDKYVIAATEWGNYNERRMVAARNLPFRDFRNYIIWGETNDGNAFYMGGYGGNAGLFANARDVLRLASIYYCEGLLPEDLRQRAITNHTSGEEENRGLGWQLQMPREGHPSRALGPRCFGHTGFTGTSVWTDPDIGISLVLLSNRLHPNVQPVDLQRVRRHFHDLVIGAVREPAAQTA